MKNWKTLLFVALLAFAQSGQGQTRPAQKRRILALSVLSGTALASGAAFLLLTPARDTRYHSRYGVYGDRAYPWFEDRRRMPMLITSVVASGLTLTVHLNTRKR